MASHLFFWAALIWVQCGARGDKAFLCKSVNVCQVELLGVEDAEVFGLEVAAGFEFKLALDCAHANDVAQPKMATEMTTLIGKKLNPIP